MALTLTIENETSLPDGGPLSIKVTGKRGIDIGRDSHLDWTLPDPSRYISSKHCEIRYREGGYWLHDVSTNGTVLNGGDHRMPSPHRLHNGDRLTIGRYIIAVSVDGEGDAVQDQAPPEQLQPPANPSEFWFSEGDVAPPMDPMLLKPRKPTDPLRPDFLDWAADVPDLDRAAQSGSSRRIVPEPDDMSWAAGPPSHLPIQPPAPPPAPTPRRADGGRPAESSWGTGSPPSQEPASGFGPGLAGTQETARRPPPPPPMQDGSSSEVLRRIAQAAGLRDDVLSQRDPNEVADQIGRLLGLIAENTMQLLNARQQAKRIVRSSSHTMIQFESNNPLKFLPSAQDALGTMLGPPSRNYLDAQRAFQQAFDDIKKHQIKTYSAMQHAVTALMAELAPTAIEGGVDDSRGISSLIASRKAKLWDAYMARWQAHVGRDPDGLIDAFMRCFSEYYDRDER